ncbi:hypothetical protein LEN26_004654, partial [Aphanomyces euteiches]
MLASRLQFLAFVLLVISPFAVLRSQFSADALAFELSLQAANLCMEFDTLGHAEASPLVSFHHSLQTRSDRAKNFAAHPANLAAFLAIFPLLYSPKCDGRS